MEVLHEIISRFGRTLLDRLSHVASCTNFVSHYTNRRRACNYKDTFWTCIISHKALRQLAEVIAKYEWRQWQERSTGKRIEIFNGSFEVNLTLLNDMISQENLQQSV